MSAIRLLLISIKKSVTGCIWFWNEVWVPPKVEASWKVPTLFLKVGIWIWSPKAACVTVTLSEHCSPTICIVSLSLCSLSFSLLLQPCQRCVPHLLQATGEAPSLRAVQVCPLLWPHLPEGCLAESQERVFCHQEIWESAQWEHQVWAESRGGSLGSEQWWQQWQILNPGMPWWVQVRKIPLERMDLATVSMNTLWDLGPSQKEKGVYGNGSE